ncbi:acyl dehydratase [Halobacterium sp. DL1]|jgi:acyl dehydratase|nr:acyl dehydratase [Halobacterium sp. DL1]
MTVYYEDLSVGDTMQFGTYEVTAEEIVAFAEQYDPQWFHVDAERAREESHFGDLAASGWHTAAMSMRLLVDEHLSEAGSLGAIGVDELRWPNPTFPGESLSVTIEVLSKRPMESDPSRGIVRTKLTTTNQDGDVKASMKPISMYERRPRE